MNKPTIYEGRAFYLVRELREAEKYISLPFAFSGNTESPRQKQIRVLVNQFDYTRSDDEVEPTIEALNEMCEIKQTKFVEPFNSMNQDYVVEFENNIKAHILIVDDYHGAGQSEYYISMEGIIVTDDVTDEQLLSVMRMLSEAFNG